MKTKTLSGLDTIFSFNFLIAFVMEFKLWNSLFFQNVLEIRFIVFWLFSNRWMDDLLLMFPTEFNGK